MTHLSPREIESRLRRTEAPPPPPELLDRLRDEIPERPAVGQGGDEAGVGASEGTTTWTRWRIAASLIFVVAVGGWLAWRTVQRMPLDATIEDRAAGGEPGGARGEARTARDQGVPPRSDRAGDAEPPATGSAVSGDETGPGSPAPTGREDEAAARERRRDPFVSFLDVQSTPAQSVPRAVPIPDPTPDEVDVAESELPHTDVVFGIPESAETSLRPSREVKKVLVPKPVSPSPAASDQTGPPALLDETPRREMPKPRPHPVPPPSTGGTAEPNDEPYGDMFFRHYGVNPFVDTEDDRFSTFGLDVDTGSYTLVRRYLEDGNLPPAEAVRVEELLNYFDYGDEPPARGDFALHAQVGPAPFASGERYRLLRFGIRARDVAAAERRPATLVFVVDVSGSMERGDRLGLVRRSLRLLLDELREDDRVGLVVYGSRGEVLLEPTTDLGAIERAVERLRPGGSTNAEEGLTLAYDLIGRHFREGSIHRLLLCSDGVANVGRTGAESILERIGAEAARGIELTTVGFGLGNYNDVLMEQLADRGDGRYAYVDDLGEAQRIFVEELTGTLQTVASDAKVQVEFDPATVSRYRLLGYENRDVADERFRDDTVDAGEIGAGHGVTALYEIKLRQEAPTGGRLATLRLRWQSEQSGEIVELERGVDGDGTATTWESAPRELRLAAVVAELGEILKGSYWAKEGDQRRLLVEAQRVSADFPGDARVAELAALVGKAAALAE